MNYIIELVASPTLSNKVGSETLNASLKPHLVFLDEPESEKSKNFLNGESLRINESLEKIDIEWVISFANDTKVILVCVAEQGEIDKFIEGFQENSKVNVEISVSDYVYKTLTSDEINKICDETMKRIEDGNPDLDGKNQVAAAHNYKNSKGNFSTFTTYIKLTEHSPINLTVGTAEEITKLQFEFETHCKKGGIDISVNRTPAEKARLRKMKKSGDLNDHLDNFSMSRKKSSTLGRLAFFDNTSSISDGF